MQFSTLFVAAFAAVAAADHILEFVNQDSTTRTIYFTGNEDIAPFTIAGDTVDSVSIPTGYTGNFYSVSEGAPNVTGMLGELAMDAYANINFFDVSAIVNPDDHNGVHLVYPKFSANPMSGCFEFPCDTAYYAPNDVQTQSTDESTLVVLLGTPGTLIKGRSHPRHFVLHSYSHKN